MNYTKGEGVCDLFFKNFFRLQTQYFLHLDDFLFLYFLEFAEQFSSL